MGNTKDVVGQTIYVTAIQIAIGIMQMTDCSPIFLKFYCF